MRYLDNDWHIDDEDHLRHTKDDGRLQGSYLGEFGKWECEFCEDEPSTEVLRACEKLNIKAEVPILSDMRNKMRKHQRGA